MDQRQQQTKKPEGVFSDLNKPAPDAPTLARLFATPSVQKSIIDALPKHMEPDRMVQVMLQCCRKIPNLMKCSMHSLVQALVACSELGLEPGSALGYINLIPFWNSSAEKFEIQIIVGFKGYVELARRSGRLKSIGARIVHEKDKFSVKFGLEEKLEHEPFLDGEPGAPRFAYCVAHFIDGGYHFEVMSIPEIERIRNTSANYSRAKDKSKTVWGQHFEEMAKKTVVRRASKYLPLSSEQAEALDKHDDASVVDGQVVTRDTLAGLLAERTQAPSKPVEDVVIPFPTSDEKREVIDEQTGEITEAGAASTPAAAAPESVNEEPPADPIDNLIWRIQRANGPELGVIKRDIVKPEVLPKNEPRRVDVARAINAREQELRAAEKGGAA